MNFKMKMFTLLKTFLANVLLLAACRKTTTKSNLKMRISKLEIRSLENDDGLSRTKKVVC